MNKELLEKFKDIKILALDFDGTLTFGAFVISAQDGRESVICSRRDSLGIDMLQDKGIEAVVISKEKNFVVEARCRKIGIKCWQGVKTSQGKLDILKKYVKKQGFSSAEVCYMGDDVNDIPCIKWAGIGASVADGHKQCKLEADYITKYNGGQGAVREICDILLIYAKQ